LLTCRRVYLQRLLARVGIGVFVFSLLAPAAAARVAAGQVPLVAATSVRAEWAEPVRAALLVPVGLPEQLIRPRATVAPTPEPTPQATPRPTLAPPATYAGGPAIVVTASWYGPGFYGNRLPCWRWLEARGLPIQFQADTWGVAHKTLPCGTMLLLRHGANEIGVPVVDRGPYIAGRELDLSPRVKAALGCTDLCTVLMQIP